MLHNVVGIKLEPRGDRADETELRRKSQEDGSREEKAKKTEPRRTGRRDVT
jgi:hypothetical protein